MDVTGSPVAIFERLGMPNVVLKLGSVCPLLPVIELCRSLALGSWLGNRGWVMDMVGVKVVVVVVDDRALMEEALLKVRCGGGGWGNDEAGEGFRDGVG